ncbi:MAG: 1-(5-phosphoribosyl)-5-[(5-phosphoribosylamino)methylideneamino]imidazole-4-carboxamide isomerase [Dehalococcoidia bacterium]
MELIPAIDIRDGRCVRLYQGDYARETVFSDDPIAMARRWQAEGAPRLHLVDLDGAREGRPVNHGVVIAIARAVGIPCQVGGGIRSTNTIARYLEAGLQRVILGSVAVETPAMLAAALGRFGEAVVVGVDARGGRVAVHGWRQQSAEKAEELMQRLAAMGVRRFVYTDISRDGTLRGPNFAATARAVQLVPARIIASGGIASLAHLRRLARTGVEGAILGRALYDGALSLPDALAAIAKQ